MLQSILRRFTGSHPGQATHPPVAEPPPAALHADGVQPFDFAASLEVVHGLPVPRWDDVSAWIHGIPNAAEQGAAWGRAELAWLSHLQGALGPAYHLAVDGEAALLSTLEPRVANATLRYMSKTLARIGSVLQGVAQSPEWGKDILIVFEDGDTYYRYVSRYYPEEGEFAFSGGMHIHDGCGHFVTTQADLRAVEPTIAHEMTHACLSHLPIPAWLNEGLAVNTERRLSPTPQQHTPQMLHAMHQKFWNPDTIQEFWSGKSYQRVDEGNLLSYELGAILVAQLAADWDPFVAFVNKASLEDAGSSAAREILGIDLGVAVSAMFGDASSGAWDPDPSRWMAKPERGGF